MLYVVDLIKDDDDKFLVLILIQMVSFLVFYLHVERDLYGTEFTAIMEARVTKDDELVPSQSSLYACKCNCGEGKVQWNRYKCI